MKTAGVTRQEVLAVLKNSWFKLREVRRDRNSNAYWGIFRWRRLESYMLFVSLSAEGFVTVNGCIRTLKPGTAVVCVPGQKVSAHATLHDERGIYVIRFDAGTVGEKQYGLERLFPTDAELDYTPSSTDLALFESMLGYWQGDGWLGRLRSQAAFHEWLYSLLQGCIAEPDGDGKAGLAWARLYIEQHFDTNVTIEWLAGTISVSPRHFRRMFKETYGVSAIEYLTEQRINQVKIRMEESGRPLGEIAREVGYENESYLRRMFKKQVGVPPAQYSANRQLRVAAYSWPNIGQLLPLQIVPRAAPIDQYWTDYYRRKLHFDVTVPLGHRYDPNREALRLFRPDFIVGIDCFMTAEERQQLSEIAPSLFLPWLTESWQAHLRLTAAFLNREEEAESWLRSYRREAEAVADGLRRLTEREAVLIIMVDKKAVYRWTDPRSGEFDGLPLAPRRIDRIGAEFTRIDREWRNFDRADRMIVLLSEDVKSVSTWHELQRSEAWRERAVVLGRRIHLIRLGPDFDYTAFNHRAILEQFKALISALQL